MGPWYKDSEKSKCEYTVKHLHVYLVGNLVCTIGGTVNPV